MDSIVTKYWNTKHKGKENKIILGDIDAKIDWGYAKEYVKAAIDISFLNKEVFFSISKLKAYQVLIVCF